jgi:amino-acid N-acetyltransferase
VADGYRRTGLGHDLVSHAETSVTGRGIRSFYLLTAKAEKFFFAGLGCEVVPRSSAPPAIAATEQFANLCSDSSAFMRKALAADIREHNH